MLLSLLLPACSPSPLAAKRLLKKPPRKLRLLKLLLKKAPTPLLLALTPLQRALKLPLLAPMPLLLLRLMPLQLLLLRLLTLLLLRLKKRSKSQPFGAMTETKKKAVFLREAAFFFAYSVRMKL